MHEEQWACFAQRCCKDWSMFRNTCFFSKTPGLSSWHPTFSWLASVCNYKYMISNAFFLALGWIKHTYKHAERILIHVQSKSDMRRTGLKVWLVIMKRWCHCILSKKIQFQLNRCIFFYFWQWNIKLLFIFHWSSILDFHYFKSYFGK